LSGQDLQSIRRFFLGKRVLYYKLLNPFPEVSFLSGIDSGFFALNIALNYRHLKFRQPGGTIHNLQGKNPGGAQPVQRQMIKQGGLILGAGNTDDFWMPEQLKTVAEQQGYYRNEIVKGITFDNLRQIIKQDHTALVAFDVDTQGNPGCYGGANAHWAVVVGYGVYHDGDIYVVATHSWGNFYTWKLETLVQSNSQLLHLPQSLQQQAVANGQQTTSPAASSIKLNAVRNTMFVPIF